MRRTVTLTIAFMLSTRFAGAKLVNITEDVRKYAPEQEIFDK